MNDLFAMCGSGRSGTSCHSMTSLQARSKGVSAGSRGETGKYRPFNQRILADSGYLSQGNVEQCAAAKIEPLIAMGRSRHHLSWRQRFAAAPKSPPDSASALEKMAYRLKTPRGRKLYGLRKQTPEPVFGIIKSVMGYRQCLLRGLENVKGEWNLVTMSWNIKRMFAMQPS